MLGYLSLDIISSSTLLGTDNVRGQLSEHIFAPKEQYCLYTLRFYDGAPLVYDSNDEECLPGFYLTFFTNNL